MYDGEKSAWEALPAADEFGTRNNPSFGKSPHGNRSWAGGSPRHPVAPHDRTRQLEDRLPMELAWSRVWKGKARGMTARGPGFGEDIFGVSFRRIAAAGLTTKGHRVPRLPPIVRRSIQ
jgi:hypothetical protein